MTQPVFEKGQSNLILNHVREGMAVCDLDGKEIGKVDRVYLGAVSEAKDERGQGPATAHDPYEPGEGTLIENVAEAFAPDKLPDELRERLLREGFIQMDSASLFAADRYVLPEQIMSVADDQVRLNVRRDELIRR